MSDPLLVRITDVIQREHDLIAEMKQLADEFSDHASRMLSMTERLQKNLKPSLENAGKMRLPRGITPGQPSSDLGLPGDSEAA